MCPAQYLVPSKLQYSNAIMRLLVFVALLGFAAAAVHHRINSELNEDWEAYKFKHGKNYKSDAEEFSRRTIWEENLKKIQHHNIRYSLGEITYTLGMNKYGDLTETEFVEMVNGLQQPDITKASSSMTFLPPLNADPPNEVDWRTKGYVTEVKDQGQCGSCWAFSATGSLEGQWFRKTGKLISLSEQNLVDCSSEQGNQGCSGGLMDQAFAYIKAHGIESEKDYPYEHFDDQCRFDPSKKAASDTGFVDIPSGNETALVAAIASVGPISVAIDASHGSFQMYSGGVYKDKRCSSTELDHGVLAVGYGTDNKGGDYYIVKNSWGADWGLQGYIWMSRNNDNNCGIATSASYPTV